MNFFLKLVGFVADRFAYSTGIECGIFERGVRVGRMLIEAHGLNWLFIGGWQIQRDMEEEWIRRVWKADGSKRTIKRNQLENCKQTTGHISRYTSSSEPTKTQNQPKWIRMETEKSFQEMCQEKWPKENWSLFGESIRFRLISKRFFVLMLWREGHTKKVNWGNSKIRWKSAVEIWIEDWIYSSGSINVAMTTSALDRTAHCVALLLPWLPFSIPIQQNKFVLPIVISLLWKWNFILSDVHLPPMSLTSRFLTFGMYSERNINH